MSVWVKAVITVCVAAALILCPTGLCAASPASAHSCCPAKQAPAKASVPDCHLCWFIDTSHSPEAAVEAAPAIVMLTAFALPPGHGQPVAFARPAADPPSPPLPPHRPLRI